MGALARILRAYTYRYPASLIANQPARPRDAARLLAYDRGTHKTVLDTFRNIGRYLPKNALLVFNETKVIPARLELTRASGGHVRILAVGREGKNINVLADRGLRSGEILRRGHRACFRVIERRDRMYLLRPLFPLRVFRSLLEREGKTPLPPYIKGTPLSERELRREYQSVFARYPGSVAAPTASLHFTRPLITKLRRAGIGASYLTLHVNLGTFLPLDEEALQKNMLHSEHYAIDPRTLRELNKARREGRPIIAVGTTVVRALESAAHRDGELVRPRGDTRLFIRPGYRFRFVDGMITNFHVPGSSLLLLVAAFIGREQLLRLYRRAIRERFRLFSFGDGMLVTRQGRSIIQKRGVL